MAQQKAATSSTDPPAVVGRSYSDDAFLSNQQRSSSNDGLNSGILKKWYREPSHRQVDPVPVTLALNNLLENPSLPFITRLDILIILCF